MAVAAQTLRSSDRSAVRAGTVVVVDRRPLVRAGLAGLARDALDGGPGAADAYYAYALPDLDAAAIAFLGAPSPVRVVLLGLADGDDPHVLVPRARHELAAPVICLLCCTDGRDFADALSASADGYLLGDLLDAETLRDAVATVEAGGRAVPPELAVCSGRQDHPRLTARCREVLALAAHGGHDEEIAEALGISVNSIRRHIREAQLRLGARTRSEAVATAVRAGML